MATASHGRRHRSRHLPRCVAVTKTLNSPPPPPPPTHSVQYLTEANPHHRPLYNALHSAGVLARLNPQQSHDDGDDASAAATTAHGKGDGAAGAGGGSGGGGSVFSGLIVGQREAQRAARNFVAPGGMANVVRHMLDTAGAGGSEAGSNPVVVKQSKTVTRIVAATLPSGASGWEVGCADGTSEAFDAVVVTIPVPQVRGNDKGAGRAGCRVRLTIRNPPRLRRC
jgi:hypothetical protein